MARCSIPTISTSPGSAVRVLGGPLLRAGRRAPGRVNLLSGLSTGNIPSVSVERGGKLLARALWYEGNAPTVASFQDRGTFSLFGALMARNDGTSAGNLFDIGRFRGRISILSLLFSGPAMDSTSPHLAISSSADRTNLLLAGSGGIYQHPLHLIDTEAAGQVGFLSNRSASAESEGIAWERPDEYRSSRGVARDDFLRSMLEHVRAEKAVDPGRPARGATDVLIARVFVYGFDTSLEIRR